MAKTPLPTRAERKAAKAAKAAAKAAKKKASKTSGVHKSTTSLKIKKEKKAERKMLAAKALDELQSPTEAVEPATQRAEEDEKDEDADGGMEIEVKAREEKKAVSTRPVGALVPFANPLADDKVARKVFRGVKKGIVCLKLGLLFL